MTSPLSFTPLQGGERLVLSSPLLTPSSSSSKASALSRSLPTPQSCSISSCTHTTTAPPLPAPFLPLAVLCFPSSASSNVFSHKSSVWLCRKHRTRLEEYRRLALTHAAQSSSAWHDDVHGGGGAHAVVDVDDDGDDDVDQQHRLLTAAHPSPTPPTFTSPCYSTFPSIGSASAALGARALVAEGKPPLSVPVRLALAAGWLAMASFLSLLCGWSVLNLMHHGGR